MGVKLQKQEIYMLNLRHFILNESDREALVEPLISLKKYSKYVTGVRKERFEAAIDLISTNYVQDNLYKSEFGDAFSYGVSRNMETIYENMKKELTPNGRFEELRSKDPVADSDLWGFRIVSSGKMLKIATKYKEYIPSEIIEFLDNAVKLNASLKVIKANLKSGSKKADQKAAAEKDPSSPTYKPMPSKEAVENASKFFKESVKLFEEELKNTNREKISRANKEIIASKSKDDLKRAVSEGFGSPVFSKFYYVSDKDKLFVPKSGNAPSQSDLDKFADEITKETIDGFIHKNVSKIAKIFERKSKISNHKVIYSKVSNAGLVDSRMVIEFEDKSKFTVYSSTEVSFSSKGKPFYRYPTRFTDVILSDGRKMSQPSEEKMAKEF